MNHDKNPNNKNITILIQRSTVGKGVTLSLEIFLLIRKCIEIIFPATSYST